MALQYEFPVISTGNLGTVIDTYGSTISTQPPTNVPSNPNGALNPIGAAYLMSPGAPELPTAVYYPSAAGSLNSNGWGAPNCPLRAVQFDHQRRLACLPGPVYWTDETYTTVTGTFSEGIPAGTGNLNSFAGIALLNIDLISRHKNRRATGHTHQRQLYLHRDQRICAGLLVPGSTAIGDSLAGVSGNFTLTRTASATARFRGACYRARQRSRAARADLWIDTDLLSKEQHYALTITGVPDCKAPLAISQALHGYQLQPGTADYPSGGYVIQGALNTSTTAIGNFHGEFAYGGWIIAANAVGAQYTPVF